MTDHITSQRMEEAKERYQHYVEVAQSELKLGGPGSASR